ncbi:hypothetical protein Tdes44962_MAKER03155 [Teratosphaeria destructans]|uniref:Uncharacterized protein n=1 Tax=Teratosphaeria destructans TaxID=418781 RepID=A0A9W7W1P3_9PEZI|nr:hypothetical protein Tdes44962_MAKER03155 [Teratosphaeria destructans]
MRTESRPVAQKAPADFNYVRRRFIRQNRGSQFWGSLKICNSQLEVLRLLSDNLDLTARAFRQEGELWQGKRQVKSHAVQNIKTEL